MQPTCHCVNIFGDPNKTRVKMWCNKGLCYRDCDLMLIWRLYIRDEDLKIKGQERRSFAQMR